MHAKFKRFAKCYYVCYYYEMSPLSMKPLGIENIQVVKMILFPRNINYSYLENSNFLYNI